MSPEQGLLGQILLWLAGRHGSWLRNPSGKAALELHNRVASRYQEIGADELEGLVRNGKQFSSGRRFILLEPIEKQGLVQPVMSLEYDFGSKIPELHLHVALFSGKAEQLVAIGFRFETPEGDGDHNYYHCQLIESFTYAQAGRLPCQDWLPTSYPAFVLDATNIVTLMVCVVLSLYGRGYQTELQASNFRNELKAYIQELGWLDTGSGKKNRLVEGVGKKWFLGTRK